MQILPHRIGMTGTSQLFKLYSQNIGKILPQNNERRRFRQY